MGALLEPTEAMLPWWGVEVRRESVYLVARGYSDAMPPEERTDEERAMAWYLDEDGLLTAPGPADALAAAVEQAVQHPSYARWVFKGGQPVVAGSANFVGDRAVLNAAASGYIVYGAVRDGGFLGVVEVTFERLAGLHETLALFSEMED